MKHLTISVALVINLLFFNTIHAQEAVIIKKPYTSFDLQEPVHSVGLLLGLNTSFLPKSKNTNGVIHPSTSSINLFPELTLRYSCAIKNGWGITAEIPFGTFYRGFDYGLGRNVAKDTAWSNGVIGRGNGDRIEVAASYVGFSLKASHLANVHKNISLQSEVGLKWLPFTTPAKKVDINDSECEFVISDGTETDKLVYMNCTPTISAASYAVPDFAFSFHVLVHSKNPAHNFVFGVNGNISFMDRIHFKYQTTDVLPTHLQSSGEFGWRMSSIGFHIGYQWMTGKKKM